MTMTEEERTLLTQRSRLYYAKRPEEYRTVRKNSGSWAFGIVGTAVLALWAFLPPDFFTREGMKGVIPVIKDAAVSLCLCSVKLEMAHPSELFEKSEIFSRREDISHVSGNDKPYEDAYDMEILSMGTKKMPSSFNEDIYSEELLPPPAAVTMPYENADVSWDGDITQLTYGRQSGENFIDLPMGGQIRNVTDISNSEIAAECLKGADFAIQLDAPEDMPQVLIMHTHTTESYEPEIREHYSSEVLSRTTDNSMNMTAVGEEMTEVFESMGIRTYHDTTVHDYPSYNGSYDRSRETVMSILKKYPSIKVVLDVHRDAIERENGERIAPSADIDGKSAAQVMLICGCDDGTMNMPDCMKNLHTAAFFQQYMEKTHPGLTRPVLFDYRHYNQDLTTGSLLIEVGGHANSIDQAEYGGRLAAEGIAEALISVSEG